MWGVCECVCVVGKNFMEIHRKQKTTEVLIAKIFMF